MSYVIISYKIKKIIWKGRENMLYETHKLVGENFYWLSLPIMFSTGAVVNPIEIYKSTGDLKSTAVATGLAAASLVVGYKACSEFGAGFPDLDKANTTPSNRHPILGRFIRSFGVVHRGKYSHSFDTITMTFVLFALLMCKIFPIIVDNHLMGALGFLGGAGELIMAQFLEGGILNRLILSTTMFTMIGAWSHLFADMGGGVRLFFWQKHVFIAKGDFFRTGNDKGGEILLRKLAKVVKPVGIIFAIGMVVFNINIFTELVDVVRGFIG